MVDRGKTTAHLDSDVSGGRRDPTGLPYRRCDEPIVYSGQVQGVGAAPSGPGHRSLIAHPATREVSGFTPQFQR